MLGFQRTKGLRLWCLLSLAKGEGSARDHSERLRDMRANPSP